MVKLDGDPDLEHIAKAYGFDYLRLENMKDSKAVIKKFLNDKKNVLLECIVDPKDVVKPE